jgi:predicted transcriptional regulator
VAYPKILPDELVARSVYPALRAMIADVLIKKYNYTQVEAARKLGVTQAAISYYLSSKRGIFRQLFKSEFIIKSVEEIAKGIVLNKISERDLAYSLTKIADYIIENKQLCELHKQFEEDLNVNECHLCEDRLKINSKEYLNNLIKKIEKE